ncbi:hypothetical protein ACFWDI_32245 [Streptomyces sp. NPDC060064]
MHSDIRLASGAVNSPKTLAAHDDAAFGFTITVPLARVALAEVAKI